MTQLDDLTDQQRSQVESFQAVTQIDDISRAISLLDSKSWNLERAIQGVYEAESPAHERSNPLADGASNSVEGEEIALRDFTNGAPSRSILDHNVGAPRRSLNNSPFQRNPLLRLFSWPFSLVWNLTSSIIVLLASIFPILSRLSILPSPQSRGARIERRSDPLSAAHRFIQNFEEDYGSKHVDFLQGGYTQALTRAKTELKFLVVILQSSEHDNTDQFNRFTLTDDSLIEFLKEKEIIVWGGDIREAEAYQVSGTLQATTFPFVAVIALSIPNAAMNSSAKMAVIDRIEGPTPAGTLIQRLTHSLARHAPQLSRQRHEREQREVERRIRSEQDAAYQSAAAADAERIRRAREEVERQKREQQEAAERESKLANLEQQKQAWRAYAKAHLVKAEPAPGAGVGRFGIRLANGERLVRRFTSQDTLEDLFVFVDSYHGDEAGTRAPPQPPPSYKHKFDFCLVSPLPRQVFNAGPALLKDQKGLWPSANIIVEELDEEA